MGRKSGKPPVLARGPPRLIRVTGTPTSKATAAGATLVPVSSASRKRSRVNGSDAAAIEEICKLHGEPTRVLPTSECRVLVWRRTRTVMPSSSCVFPDRT